MENHQVLSLTPADHVNLRVRQVGFELTDPYVEQCWGAIVGPSATMLLRRMSATITRTELAASVGLGSGGGTNSLLMGTSTAWSASGSPPGTRGASRWTSTGMCLVSRSVRWRVFRSGTSAPMSTF